MPQAPSWLQEQWPEMDTEAIRHLESRGFKLTRDWCWRTPQGHIFSKRDLSAIQYLCLEWDYGGDVPWSYHE